MVGEVMLVIWTNLSRCSRGLSPCRHMYTHIPLQASVHMCPTLAFILCLFLCPKDWEIEYMNESKTILLQREICIISEKHT